MSDNKKKSDNEYLIEDDYYSDDDRFLESGDDEEDDNKNDEKEKSLPFDILDDLDALDLDAEHDIDSEEEIEEEDMEEHPFVDDEKNLNVNRSTIVPDHLRQTSDFMTQMEFAKVWGNRSRDIDNGAQIYIDPSNYRSTMEIALHELKQGLVPMTIVRRVGVNKVEHWKVNELNLPKLPPLRWLVNAIDN